MPPLTELCLDGFGNGVERGEVLVVEAETTSERPDPFDGIQFRAVWREEVEFETAGDSLPPVLVEAGVVVLGVVGDHHDPSPRRGRLVTSLTEERVEGLAVEAAILASIDELAVAEPDGTEAGYDAAALTQTLREVGAIAYELSGITFPEDAFAVIPRRDNHCLLTAVTCYRSCVYDVVRGCPDYPRTASDNESRYLEALPERL